MESLVKVKFNGVGNEYIYWTKLPLIEGATYWIMADHRTEYSNPVQVVKINADNSAHTRYTVNGNPIREITEAELASAPARPKTMIKNVYYNPEKRITTVLWTDNFPATLITQHELDEYDGEKALAMAFMKRFYNNRGCFNEDLKKFAIHLPKKVRVRRVKHD